MAWWDFYKLWSYSSELDPLSKKANDQNLSGAGVTQPDAIPDIRQDGSFWGGGRGLIRLRDSNDFIDLSTVTNRQSRYKEYERLRNVAEIEMAMTVIADEACIAASTKIATLFHGYKTIEWLAKNYNGEPFLVYCWDFKKHDYTLGWAYDPRIVHENAETVQVMFDNGDSLIATPDHRILAKNETWVCAGDLKMGDELMAFYRIEANRLVNNLKTGQYPRIYSTRQGWIHQQQMIEQWKFGEDIEKYETVNKALRYASAGVPTQKIVSTLDRDWVTLTGWINKYGITYKEAVWLGKKRKTRKVIGVVRNKNSKVYDLSVTDHENFCTDSLVVHNCQRGENDHVFEITGHNGAVIKELEFLLFNRKMLNMDRRIWNIAKRLCIFGDYFAELVINPENPKDGILKIQELPPDSVYRIETTRGKLVEFQQSKEGPDYQSLTRSEVTSATEQDLMQATAIRFAPKQIIHWKIGDDRKMFYPYGQSLIEPARGPAHQLRLMEDSMVVYRLCLAGETRIRTSISYKYIKDICKNDIVFSYNSNGTLCPTKILNFVDNGVKKVLRVRSKHVELIGTNTHPVLVERDGVIKYVDMQDLVLRKDKLILTKYDSHEKTEIPRILGETWAKLNSDGLSLVRSKTYKNKSDLLRKCYDFGRAKQFIYAEGKALPYDKAIEICTIFGIDPKYLLIVNKGEVNPERINLPKYVNEEFARLFGFLCGDGHLTNGFSLGFSTSPDPITNSHYQFLLDKFFGRSSFGQDKRRSAGLGRRASHCVVACRILTEMGYINDHALNRIPEWVFRSPPEIRREFVEGFSDADGCERFTKKGTWFSTIELSNKHMIEDIKELWSSIGMCSGHIKKRKREGGHMIDNHIAPPITSYSVTISNLSLPSTENVLSIEPYGEERVYDITVESTSHNFIANGVPVHNSRAPERRVFYIDVSNLPPFKIDAFMDRLKDQFRKKKVSAGAAGGSGGGASGVDEKWHVPALDEDYWLPIRGQSNTRIDTLQGAANLGEIDDALYFRNKLFTALNFPKNYFNSEDPAATRITLSAQDVKFARMIERIQSHVLDGIIEICERHLELLGYPEETYEDLKITMTPPSDWRELSRSEVVNNRLGLVTSLKGAFLMSDWDLLTKYFKLSESEVEEIIARNKIQKLEDAKLQILIQNPQLLGIGSPGTGEPEMGAEAGGPNPMLGPEGQEPPPEQPPEDGEEGGASVPSQPKPKGGGGMAMAETTPEDIEKYDLAIQGYDKDLDHEEIDFSQD